MAKTKTKPSHDADFSEILKSMQATLSVAPFVAPQIEQFWDTQDTILNETQRFAAHWFARRHQAVQSSLNTARALTTGEARDPLSAVTLLMDWQKQSTERMIDDAQDWFETFSRCAEHAVKTETATLEETADLAQKATKSAKSEPV
ncbi:hypothetical protein [Marivita geojedonensis]|uniref:Phasin domain-containing protein n=1 Tax=Marivita geojedonensis TaxID=1123756 RepID=A0A1X4N992_9RHOB|nr:hypothetical protein [Marivita geojedonensis]OSQ42927.1 hypothetical protein MGEO_20100 [Marivita geojedonensis]PRY72127.1 phasin protein [Marivita geojedonensis]